MVISIATGVLSIDKELKRRMKEKYNADCRVFNFRKNLDIESENIIVLSENLTGDDIEFTELLYALKKRNKIIILLLKSKQDPMFFKALTMSIFDIIFMAENDSIVDDVFSSLEIPKTSSDYLMYFNKDNSGDNKNIPIELDIKKVVQELSEDEKISLGLITERVVEIPVVNKSVVEVERLVSFDKKVFAIWGNSEFGCEFAYILAKLQKQYNVILMDLNFISPNLPCYLNTDISTANINKSSFSVLQSMFSSGSVLTGDILRSSSVKRRDLNNLYMVTSDQSLSEGYLHPSAEVIKFVDSLINTAYKNFDITILLCNDSVVDPYTVCAMTNSDYILAARHQNADELNTLFNHLSFIKLNKQVDIGRVKYIAFEYDPKYNINLQLIKDNHLFDLSQHYLGHISFCNKRLKLKNSTRRIYARRTDTVILDEYICLLFKFNIVCKRNKNLFKCFRHGKKFLFKFSFLIKKFLNNNGGSR